MIDLRTSCYLSLNRTGAQLWPLLVEGTTRERLVLALVDGHRIDHGDAGRDVDRLLAQLVEAGVLSRGPGDADAPRA